MALAAALPLAVSIGDASGIGPELVLQAWRQRQSGQRPFFVLADPHHLQALAKGLGWRVPLADAEPQQTSAIFNSALPVVPLKNRFQGTAQRPHDGDASGTIESIARAVELVHEGIASAIVTAPIAKQRLYKAGFAFPGHTEFLGAEATRLWGRACQPVMMLWSSTLAVVPITVHVPLAEVPGLLTVDLIVTTAHLVAQDLILRFGLAAPRIAITGLNPHAGESATMGLEDRDIIGPAIARLRSEGLNVTGPHPADTLFHAKARTKYDVALAMYHDQALIPIKTLAFDEGVNVTLGLPFVRTSPDHGTAFDIAGQGIADPTSLIAALALAERLT